MRLLKRALTLAAALLLLIPAALAQETTIRLSFAGDTTLGGHEGWMDYSIGTFKVMAQEQGDYGYFLKYAREIFEQDDLTFVNLEGVLADSSKGQDKNKKWQFRGTTEYVDILTLGSVEAVTLANNHARDFGNPGLESTRQALDAAGIGWAMDQDVFIFEKDGVKLAFIGLWWSTFPRYRDWLGAEIPRLKAQEGVDAVIFNYHGGKQYVLKHNKEQEEAMRFAIDSGADLAVGHHPHVLQGIETYKGRSIVYSLGDFCYGGNRKPRTIEYPTMILGVEMTFDTQGYKSQRLTIHPYRISGTAPRNNYQPLPAQGEQIQEVIDILQADTPFPLNPYVEGQGAVQDMLYAR